MRKELKPCPFCGGEARVRSVASFSRIGFNVVCTNCPAALGHDGTSSDEAIAAWNTRPEAAQVRVKPEAVEALASYQQVDEDGIMVLVSRQAIEECLPALRAALDPDTVTGWQDISTAPEGAKDVLVGWHCEYSGRFVWVKAGLVKGVWYISGSTGTVCYPTHYFVLPPAPEKEG